MNHANRDGDKPLSYAIGVGSLEVTQALLAAGADLATDGASYLFMVAGGNRADLVKLLVDKGVNVNSKDDDGKTALHYACENQADGALTALLDKGANIAQVDSVSLVTDSIHQKKT